MTLEDIRAQFPIFTQYPDLLYLDNASTTQKPHSVVSGIADFYLHTNANVHRGIYPLAAQATHLYEGTREKVRQFLQAPKKEEIVFTSGTTAAINLVAHSFVLPQLKAGDNVVISAMEHHANLVPWQMICQQKRAELRVIPMNNAGDLDLEYYRQLVDKRTKIVAITHISNTLGTVNPVAEMIEIAHQKNVPILLDGAQSVAHYPIDVQALDCDFFVFSGHKIFGPTGVGVLYGKAALLEKMPPYQFGGDMIKMVTFEETTFAKTPSRFEAGTPNIAGVIGLAYAIDFVMKLDRKLVSQHIQNLGQYAREKLAIIDGLSIIGNPKQASGIVSFVLKNIHPHDVATFLGEENICIRAGHHCTQPIMDFYGLPATNRASFSLYNHSSEIDQLAEAIVNLQKFFA